MDDTSKTFLAETGKHVEGLLEAMRSTLERDMLPGGELLSLSVRAVSDDSHHPWAAFVSVDGRDDAVGTGASPREAVGNGILASAQRVA
jgi:hypothetical protein